MRRTVLLVWSLGLMSGWFGLTELAGADCGDDPNNLYQNVNCDFDTDVSGWMNSPEFPALLAILTHNTTDGFPPFPRSPLGALQADTSTSSFSVVGPCAPIAANTEYTFGGWINFDADPPFCRVDLEEFANATCIRPRTAFIQGSGALAVPGASPWTLRSTTFTSSASTVAVTLVLTCPTRSTPSFSVLADNFFILPGPGIAVPVELQSFTIE